MAACRIVYYYSDCKLCEGTVCGACMMWIQCVEFIWFNFFMTWWCYCVGHRVTTAAKKAANKQGLKERIEKNGNGSLMSNITKLNIAETQLCGKATIYMRIWWPRTCLYFYFTLEKLFTLNNDRKQKNKSQKKKKEENCVSAKIMIRFL